ncbi:unnamed protein product [Clonostachys rosea f. rosea IK726]|uniref:Uncharacterized protein n=1 Tax=Clonostachys rosea f. rosea IK726 TaxID=1349383 RepID=A0ACA9TWJ2_BIOOC|nr:unnamed protein product [Clonostachys rosea f. rosea IK726]
MPDCLQTKEKRAYSVAELPNHVTKSLSLLTAVEIPGGLHMAAAIGIPSALGIIDMAAGLGISSLLVPSAPEMLDMAAGFGAPSALVPPALVPPALVPPALGILHPAAGLRMFGTL